MVLAQQLFRYFDRNFVFPRACHLRRRDFGQAEQFASHLVGQRLHGALVEAARQLQGECGEQQFGLAHDGLLGAVGELLDCIDAILHFVQQLAQVDSLVRFDHDARIGFEGIRLHPLDTVQIVDSLFYLADDALLNLLRRRPRVGRGDKDHFDINGGKHCALDAEGRSETHHHDNEHQQVSRHRVVGEPGDDAPGVISAH